VVDRDLRGEEEEIVSINDELVSDLEAGLGLVPPLEFEGVNYSGEKEDMEGSDVASEGTDEGQEESLDSEVEGSSRPPKIAYDDEQAVATKRVFVTIELQEETAQQVGAVITRLRERFPLDAKQLDSVVRWVEPGVMHITLHSLEVAAPRLEEAQVLMALFAVCSLEALHSCLFNVCV
jgi:hypothetical protein